MCKSSIANQNNIQHACGCAYDDYLAAATQLAGLPFRLEVWRLWLTMCMFVFLEIDSLSIMTFVF
jgi:hypothetical protein